MTTTRFGHALIRERSGLIPEIRRTSYLLVKDDEIEICEFSDGTAVVLGGKHRRYAWGGTFERYFFHAPWTWHLSRESMIRRAIRTATA